VWVVGYVGAGAQVHRYEVEPENLDELLLGPIATRYPPWRSKSVRAARVNAQELACAVRRWSPPALTGKLCVVAHADGRIVIERLREGDAGILWAAAVKGMIAR
jgi:hypothetical protein